MCVTSWIAVDFSSHDKAANLRSLIVAEKYQIHGAIGDQNLIMTHLFSHGWQVQISLKNLTTKHWLHWSTPCLTLSYCSLFGSVVTRTTKAEGGREYWYKLTFVRKDKCSPINTCTINSCSTADPFNFNYITGYVSNSATGRPLEYC